MDNSATIGANAYAWALETMCRIHRKPFSLTLALQQAAPPYSIASIQQTAVALGMRCELRAVPAAELQRQSLPCLAIRRKKPEADHCDIVAVLHGDEATITQLMPGADAPQSVSRGDFSNGYSGSLLMFTPAAGELHGEGAPDAARCFGFRWFVPELLRHKRIWRDVLLASLAIQLMALATPVFTQIIIDKVIVHRTVNTLIVIGIGLAVFMLFSAVMNWARQYLVLHTGNRIDAVLGSRVFEHLFRLPPRYFEHRPTGTVVARMHGVETIREFISGAAVTLILDLPFMLVFLAVMFYYSWLLTLIAVAVIVLIAALSVLVTPLLRQRLNRQFLLGARNQAFVTEYVAGMDTVKSLQMEPQLNHRYGSHLADYLNAVFETRQLSNSYNVAATALEQLLTLSILCAGAWLVMQSGELTVGMLVAFQMFAGRLAQPVLRIVGLWQEFQQADIAVRRLGDLMDAPPEPYTLAPARDMAGRGRIDIRGLGFRYADNLPYLYRDFNLAVPPGQCVSIMGPSGSGKSTLARLLQGFCVPSEGIISIDGHDTRHLAANELRQHFGVVPQDTLLFSGTIHENLALANPHASFDDMVEACRLAEIHDAIELLPQGYQTVIGEHGAGLSGGQKQRIAIARALLKRPRILIFDESTSSLDAETAEQFAATINRFRGRITLIFITHHLPRGLVVDQTVTLAA